MEPRVAGAAYGAAEAATLLAFAGIRYGESVADVGCGAGLLTYPLAAAAGPDGTVYGVEADALLLARAVARRESAIRWLRGDPGRLPLADGRFHKAVTAALDGVPGVPGILQEMARVLVPGGRGVALGRRADLPELFAAAGFRITYAAEEGDLRYVTGTTAV